MGKMNTFLASLTDAERRILATTLTVELIARQEIANRSTTTVEDVQRIATAFDAMTNVQPLGSKPSDFARKSSGRPPVPVVSSDPIADLESALADQVASEKVAA
jgi:signal recognition particle GTPase